MKQIPDMSKYERAESPTMMYPPVAPPSGRNPFLRCPPPQSMCTTGDFLSQYYQSGVPQYRIFPPRTNGVRINLT